MEISTILIQSDFDGKIGDTGNCPGYHTFKRACRENIPLHIRMWMSYRWLFIRSCSGKWFSYKDGYPVRMTDGVEVGDKITFIKRGKRR